MEIAVAMTITIADKGKHAPHRRNEPSREPRKVEQSDQFSEGMADSGMLRRSTMLLRHIVRPFSDNVNITLHTGQAQRRPPSTFTSNAEPKRIILIHKPCALRDILVPFSNINTFAPSPQRRILKRFQSKFA